MGDNKKNLDDLAKWLELPISDLESWVDDQPKEYGYTSFHIPKKRPRNICLFHIDPGYAFPLDSGQLPDAVRKEFACQPEPIIIESNKVKVLRIGIKWAIDDAKALYHILKERDTLNVYQVDARRIDAPNKQLRDLQRRIYHKILRPIQPNAAATGFVPNQSIVDNARPHVAKEVVINIDLKDFFHSISWTRVQGFWDLRFDKKASEVLTNICCYKGRLPQGAPTSPALSNFVNALLDARFIGMVSKYEGDYTRYADDLTFSFAKYGKEQRRALHWVGEILDDEEYEIQKKKKVRVQRSHQRQTVTGLVVNAKINLPRETRRKIRAMQHQYDLGLLPLEQVSRLRGYQALLQMVRQDASGILSDRKIWNAQRTKITIPQVEITKLIGIVSDLANLAESEIQVKGFFQNILDDNKWPKSWQRRRIQKLTGAADRDSEDLIKWVMNLRTFPNDPRYTYFGVLLEALLPKVQDVAIFDFIKTLISQYEFILEDGVL